MSHLSEATEMQREKMGNLEIMVTGDLLASDTCTRNTGSEN